MSFIKLIKEIILTYNNYSTIVKELNSMSDHERSSLGISKFEVYKIAAMRAS